MAAAPSKVLTNLLEINIPTSMLNHELWDKDAAQCVANVIKYLLLNAELYPLFDPAKKTSHMVQWAFIEDHLLRHAHQHYPSGQTAAAVALRRVVHDLGKSLLVKIFTPYWPRAEEAKMGDYDDDADVDAAHVRDAAGNIIERRPKTAIFMKALHKEVFLGAEVHNQQMQAKIQGFKGPTAPTNKALNETTKYLDSMDAMVKVLSSYKDCASAEGLRRKELHAALQKWGKTDTMGLPIILFIEGERKKELAGTATFRDLIASLQDWLTFEIHERMVSTVSGKTVTALATTMGCKLHGANAEHTTEQCKGITSKRKYEGGNNGKGKRPMNERSVGFNAVNAAAVTTNQDKPRSGYNNYKGSSSKHGAGPKSKGGYHGSNSSQLKHPGGSLEDLMTRTMKGNYKGKNFDPTKSAKYQALIAHLQHSGGGVPNYGGGANAHTTLPPPPTQGGMFAFHFEGLNMHMGPYTQTEPTYLHLNPRLLMKDQSERVVERLLTAANQVSGLEALAESQVKDPLPVEVYNQIRDDYLEDITRTMSGTDGVDPETLAEVLMLDLTVQDEILTEYSSHDIQEVYELTRTASDDSSDFELYGANQSDNDDKESSADEKQEIEYTEYDVFGSPCDSDGERWYYDSTFCSQTMRTITPSYSPPVLIT
jgi:hypothetical protein